ncbi:MAG: DNA-3-methyladenine glycosylase 2 family protein [Oscillospiraceae bacterium]|jgi:N-glycosylase/DNA lyase|nr:DNA-3-methyladenine glycosylase 2 family protein [Oscillospiraceae bacterium]
MRLYGDCAAGITLAAASELSLEATFECGQCFRWNRAGSPAPDGGVVYQGVALGRAARLTQNGEGITIDAPEADIPLWREYFDLSLDYAEIRRGLSADVHMRRAAEFGAGIRILRQDKWEALASFIISQCNNIPRIKKIVETLCALFGDELSPGSYAFPPPERIAGLTEAQLAPLHSGYRAPYIIEAARAVASGELPLDALAELSAREAVAELKKLPGVGEKVASCAALFGLHLLDCFPVDTWMKKAIAAHYGAELDPARFSPYAGVAQQYLFYYERSGGNSGGH